MSSKSDNTNTENTNTNNTNDTNDYQVQGKKGRVSSRGASNLALPMAYLQDFFTALQDPCDKVNNPRGYVPVCVAENKLVTELLQQRLATLQSAQAGFDASLDVYSYNNMLGLPFVRQVLAEFLQDHFWKPPQEQEQQNNNNNNNNNSGIDSNHIAVGAGVMSFLNSLFYALGNPQDAVLIPAPSYAAFDNDIRAYAGCVPIAVACQDPAKGPTPQELETAKRHVEEELGLKVRFLLLTNPHNPLGVVYSPQQMINCIEWAREYSMHIVVDEIYALSVFDDTANFSSILEILNNELGTDIYLLWGLSKDFGASGFRFGVLYTQNELLLEALGNLNAFAAVSHPM
jgi:1-aminocyclopropane-1-carboxylate synthase